MSRRTAASCIHGALLMVLSGAFVGSAAAPSAAATEPPPSVTVSGEASVGVAPDRAEVRAGVISQGKTAREASDANNRAMAMLMQGLKDAGIDEKDVQTSRIAIQPLYESGRSPSMRITGFQASNQVIVRVRALARMSDVIDRLVAAGANDLGGIDFQVSEASKALDAVRADAISDARRKAEIYARAAGVGIGRPLAIVEDGSSPPPMFMRADAKVAAASVPVAPGEKTLRVGVTVTFELTR